MSIFSNTSFDNVPLRDGNDSRLVLQDVQVSDEGDWFDLMFVGAFNPEAFQRNIRFWPAKTRNSKLGILLGSLEKNLNLEAVPDSLEALIGHELLVRRWTEEKLIEGVEKKVEYVEIIEDYGSSDQVDVVDEPAVFEYSSVLDIINGKAREDAQEQLMALPEIHKHPTVLEEVKTGKFFEILLANGLIGEVAGVFVKRNRR